jgi:Na+-driven multidrug efflux pump
MIFAEQINGLFINKEQTELLNYAVKAFRMYVSVYMIEGFNIILVGFYSAIEKPIYSMAISTGRGLVMIVASMFVMTELFGSDGVWLSSVVSEAVCLLMGLMIFTRYYYGELFSESSTENLGNSINLKDFDY